MAEQAAVEFYPLDMDSDSKGNVCLFGRTTDGKRVIVRDAGFSFYFYLLGKNLDGKNLEKLQQKLEFVELADEKYKVLRTVLCQKKLLDKPVTALQVFVNHPGAARAILEEYDGVEIKEADISLGKKYLIERQITPLSLCRAEGLLHKKRGFLLVEGAKVESVEGKQLEEVKLMSIDIEVAGFMGNLEEVREPVISIAMCGEGFERVLTWKDFPGRQDYVEVLEDERGMLARMVEIIHEYQPDYVLGYYSDGFDFPYLKSRADQLGVKLGLGLDGSMLKVRLGSGGKARITGIPHIDVCKFIKTTMAETLKLDAYDLDSVAGELLGQRKVEMSLEQIDAAWKNGDLSRLVAYNLQDASLTLQLFLKVQHNFHELVRLIGLMPQDVCRLSYGQLVEHYLMKRAPEFGEILQNKPSPSAIAARRYESYQGAFVMQPQPGLYEDVVMLDYRSLYPSIIIAKNISPSSLNVIHGYKTPEIVAGNEKKVYYFDEHPAFIPSVIKEIVVRRQRIKEILKQEPDNPVLKARSQALKTLANSAYGMFGFFGARYYSRECAESITAFGRQYILETIEKARNAGFQVVYSDSVSGETKTFVKENEKIYEVAIEDLFKKVDQKSDSGKEYDFKEEVEVLTLDADGRSVFKPLIYVMRHHSIKKMFRVHFTNHWYIDVTEDHSLIGYQSTHRHYTAMKKQSPLKRLVEVRPQEIGRGVYSIIALKNLPSSPSAGREYPQEVYEFMGYFICDGSFMRNKTHQAANKDYYLRLSLGSDVSEILEKLIKPLQEKGYIRGLWLSKTRRGDVTFNGLALVRILAENFRDLSGKKIIPHWLFEEKEENIASFLRGLFSADGCVMMRNNAPIIKYTSISPEFIGTVRKLLYRVGVSHSVFRENSINTYKQKNRVYSSGSFSHNIIIKDRGAFVRKVGFLVSRKQMKASIKTNSIKKKFVEKFEFELQSVKKIEEIKIPRYVYDLEVDDTHRFFANYVLVHNTDSISLILGKKTLEDAQLFLQSVNDVLPEFMELELEKFYTRGIFVAKKGKGEGAKKKYALLDSDGRLKIVGFETVRKDWSKIARETQKKVLEIILREGGSHRALELVQQVIQQIQQKKVQNEKMVILTQLKMELEEYKQIGPHVAVARKLRQQGYDVKAGSLIRFIIQEGKGMIRDKAVLPEQCAEGGYDAHYYVENQMIPAMEKIFEVFHIDLRQELSGGQTSLGEF